MTQRTGLFIMIDGIAGSGKTTILNTFADLLKQEGNTVFRLSDWSTEHAHPPNYRDISNHDVFFTFEPTRTWVGAAIRQEMSRTDLPYDGRALAHAFAIDRQIMYRRVILPALEDGKMVIQDRGFTTSLIYQPIMDDHLTVDDVRGLPGNTLAIDNAPDHLILTNVPPNTVIERIRQRNDVSRGIFEDIELLRKWHERFRAKWFRSLLSSAGTTVHEIDTSTPLQATINQSTHLLRSLVAEKNAETYE